MKLIKILLINFLILLFVLVVSEAICFFQYKMRFADLIDMQSRNMASTEEGINEAKKHLAVRYKKPFFIPIPPMDASDRIYQGTNSKKPIIVVGCSYAYGICLDRNDNLSAKLNQKTGRKVYNRAISGSGPQFMYLQLKSKGLGQEIKDAEYVIYPFIYSHISRSFKHLMNYSLTDINPLLEEKNGELVVKKQPLWFLYPSFITKVYLQYSDEQNERKEMDQGKPIFFKTLEESYKEAKKKYPNVKFVLIEVSQANMCRPDYKKGSQELTEDEINRIKSMGIIYLNAEQLVGHDFRDVKKYRVADEDHPNAKMWDEISTKLVEKLKM